MKYAFLILVVGVMGCGRDGAQGIPGPQGPQGEPGQSIVGAIGPAGEAGADAILEVIDPCGDAPGVIDEVLIRLHDGQVLASFSENANGKNTRFVLVPEGSYTTTDGSDCNFTVDVNGVVL